MRLGLRNRVGGRSLFCLLAIALVILLSQATVSAAATRLTATVDYAKSGNTLELLFDFSPELPTKTVRLAAIEAPDYRQLPWGEASRKCLNDLGDRVSSLRDKIVHFEPVNESLDAHNRLWAYGWLGRDSINQVSLLEGCTYLADPAENQTPHHQEFLYAQERARLLGLGIWDPRNPLRETARTFRERSPSP